MATWELTGDTTAKTGRPKGLRQTNHIWPHPHRPTSLYGATEWMQTLLGC
jgi:hypothetical protein